MQPAPIKHTIPRRKRKTPIRFGGFWDCLRASIGRIFESERIVNRVLMKMGAALKARPLPSELNRWLLAYVKCKSSGFVTMAKIKGVITGSKRQVAAIDRMNNPMTISRFQASSCQGRAPCKTMSAS